jgi:hypothetical protein
MADKFKLVTFGDFATHNNFIALRKGRAHCHIDGFVGIRQTIPTPAPTTPPQLPGA